MATDLVLPEISAQGLVQACDRSLVRQLRSSWNVRLQTSWSRSRGLESLTIDPGPTAAELIGALDGLARANAERAPPSQLAKALAVLTAVCAKPADFDDAKVVLWSERLKQVLGEFPGDIAMAAISDWPKTEGGKWWPTEKEIRDECAELMRFRELLAWHLKQSAEMMAAFEAPKVEPPSDGRWDEPKDDTDAGNFVKLLQERDPERAKLYLVGARYTQREVCVRTKAAQFALERFAQKENCRHVRILAPYAINPDTGRVAEWA